MRLKRHVTVSLIILLLLTLLAVAPAQAITYGTPDGDGHPNVGALIAEWRTDGVKEQLCSGTLIAPTVFLTAAHCTVHLEQLGIPNDQVWVSFDEDVDPVTKSTNLIQGRWVSNSEYNQRQSDPADLAVVLFDEPVKGIEPASLPAAGLFDQMAADRELHGQKFTAVGYGVHEPTTGGGEPDYSFSGARWKSVSEFSALNEVWLRLSQNDATGDGGTCYGDSGGPNFLGAAETETNIVASVTVTGDAMCLATNTTYRLDTPSARRFIGQYVQLP